MEFRPKTNKATNSGLGNLANGNINHFGATLESTVKAGSNLSRSASLIDMIADHARVVTLVRDADGSDVKILRGGRCSHGLVRDAVKTLFSNMEHQNAASFRPRFDLFIVDVTHRADIPVWEYYRGDGAEKRTTTTRARAASEIFKALGVSPPKAKDATTFGKCPPKLRDGLPPGSGSRTDSYYVSTVSATLAWSYCRKRGSTVALLSHAGSEAKRIADHLVEELIRHRAIADCPMLPALLAALQILPETERWFGIHAAGIFRAAEVTGYHHNLLLTARKDKNFDPIYETRKVSGIAVNMATNHHSWEGLLGLATFMLEEIEACKETPDGAEARTWAEGIAYIIEHTKSLAGKSKAMCQEAVSWQEKASIQLQGLSNLIAQREREFSKGLAIESLKMTERSVQLGKDSARIARDSQRIAEDSKRDSTSMKAIAAVTMFFLPGTFAASIFAMPIFQWTAPAGGDVVGQRIWVYWAVAVPLTLATVGLFFLWDHLMNRAKSIRHGTGKLKAV